MTYEEAKKGLECCLDRTKGCKICPYIEDEDCLYAVRKDTLVLINRLGAEKEQIRRETAKVLIEELEYYSSYENTDLKGGISCLKQYAHEKYGVEVDK